MKPRSNYVDFSDVIGLDNLNEDMKERLICPICTGVVCDPLQCPEEHVFCSHCIRDWGGSCPQCRKNDFKKSRLIWDILSGASIYCYFCERYLQYEEYLRCNHKESQLYEKVKALVIKERSPIYETNNHFHLFERVTNTNTNLNLNCGMCDTIPIENEQYKCKECNVYICKHCYNS